MNIKKVFIISVLVTVFLTMAAGVQAEVFFGVKPSTVVQSSYFGFLAGTSMVLQFGLDYARVSVTVEGQEEIYDWVNDRWITQSYTDEGSGSMMMPHGGAKLYLKPRRAGQTSPYFLLDVFKAFTSVSLEMEDADTEDVEEFAGDLLSPWGFCLAFGAEYHFSDRFSLGGEYGFRNMMSSAKNDDMNMEVSTSLGATYAAMTANFAF
jgi:hypothetical protein